MRCRMLTVAGLAVVAAATLSMPLLADEETLDHRRTRLEQMSDAEKTRLLQKKRRFDELARQEKKRYRQLHQELANDPQYEQLRGTLQRYSDWLKTLTPVERAGLSQLPADKRLARVRELMDAQATERFRLMVSEVVKSKDVLSPKDLGVICDWTDRFLCTHSAEILATIGDNRFSKERSKFDPDKNVHFLRFWYFRPDPRQFHKPPPDRDMPPGPPPPPNSERPEDRNRSEGGWSLEDELAAEDAYDRLPRPSPEEEEQLVRRVSQQARAALKKATSQEERSLIIQNWMRAAAFSRIMPPVSPEDLDRFVRESLEKDERDRLESMPRDRMYHELRQLYFRKRFQGGRRGMGPPGMRREGGGQGFDGGRGRRGGANGKQDWGSGRGRGKPSPDQERNRRPDQGGDGGPDGSGETSVAPNF